VKTVRRSFYVFKTHFFLSEARFCLGEKLCFEVHGASGMDAAYNSFCIFEPDGGDWLALRLKRLTPGETAQIHIG